MLKLIESNSSKFIIATFNSTFRGKFSSRHFPFKIFSHPSRRSFGDVLIAKINRIEFSKLLQHLILHFVENRKFFTRHFSFEIFSHPFRHSFEDALIAKINRIEFSKIHYHNI